MRTITASATVAALLLSHAAVASSSAPGQVVFQAEVQQQQQQQLTNSSHPVNTLRKPFGRFLHVTDLHPDPHYKHGSAVNAACHHKKPKKSKPDGKLRAGWWGSALSDCDSPPRLVESSLTWAARNLVQSGSASAAELGLDFIIWTGDSARHDNDNKLPRSNKEIFELNRWTLQQLETAFPGVPLVPTVGNNDIFPHNILFPGPNAVTKEYVHIWQDHIPEYEFHTFEQAGYYVKELLPNRLAAMSLNTLYFYDNNKAVDGCVKTKRGKGKEVDPGTAQLDWLEVQLDLFRKRGMQVHLLGHVPPTAGNYFERCYRRYTDIVLRFQDTVVAQHFGHMNTDAFFIQEDEEAAYRQQRQDVHVKEDGLPGDLKQDYSTLPGKGRTDEDMYSVFYIAPSIIPTFYPSIRLWTYNVSEEARYVADVAADAPRLQQQDEEDDDEEEEEVDDADADPEWRSKPLSRHHHRPTPPKKRKGRKHKKKRNKTLPRHASALSPSRTNTYLSLLGYSQWVMDIDEQNDAIEAILHPQKHSASTQVKGDKKKKHRKDDDDDEERKKREHEAEKMHVEYRLEYATYAPAVLWSEFDASSNAAAPVPRSLLEKELRRAGLHEPFITSLHKDEDDVKGKPARKLAKPLRKFTDYSLGSATVGEMMDLARKLMVDHKLWARFKRRIYAECGWVP
ncbi:related to PPN1-vacuolar endopolyphosphatase [Sporisorium reilianum f. sp. reilianum]|uniref:Related to PPN1-vacuolar endopolyphosphatase n=1 Tax=Sporisorium reilianum f. sp. reilianum TaxID=72559 RepID=A0A2N8U8B7_9BASI|nr:related to PPN1-vacuolar endopolyphosphatase [Sporisorium reilianum f. sp. reilianum]